MVPALNSPLKPRNNQPNAASSSRVSQSFLGPVRLEQDGGQGRAERKRIERRNQRRGGDRQGELPVKLAGNAR